MRVRHTLQERVSRKLVELSDVLFRRLGQLNPVLISPSDTSNTLGEITVWRTSDHEAEKVCVLEVVTDQLEDDFFVCVG